MINNIYIRYLSLMLAMLLGVADIGHAAAPLLADDDGLGQLTLLADPSDGGSVSGGGAYATGQTVNLRASASTGFVFTGWTRADGTEVSNTANFAYTKQEGDEVLTAHFRYNPGNPNEPVTPVFPEKKPTHSVSVSAVPADGGSVSVEKNVVEEGTQTRVRASAASSFQFLGWYVADTLYSKSADFYYTMGEEDIHFEARFQYNPGSPNDPPQPDIPFITPDYNVAVTVSPADGGSANTERSSLKEGEQTRLRASAAAGFRFTGWYVADTLYNTVADFYYTMGQADILFEARFRYDPGSPNEPPQPDLPVIKPKHQVTAEAVPADGGSVSVGTGTVEEGQSTRLSASGASGFVFLGWYANDSLYSQSANYDYTMEQSDIHFEARFQYNPGSPNEPSSPDTHRYELYLTTMRGMPGRTIQYPVYLNALDTLKDMHFQLNFPEGTIPDMENIRLSGKSVGYTLTYEKVEAAAEVRNFGPLRAGEDKKLISYAMHLIGGTTPPCNTRLLTINLSLGEDFSGNEAQQVSVNQISMTDVEGNTETASARHGSLIMREASELGNIFYLTINATGFGSARVGSKHIRNSVQVIDFVEKSSANVYFVPDDGYHLEQVLIGEEDVTSQVVENRLFIASIQDDINLEVTFAEGASASNPLTVTATGNGVVTYIDSAVRDSEQTFDVSYGSEVVLNLTPDKGHHLANVTVNEENAMEQVANGQLTIESMTAASTIAATFEPNLHTVTFAYADTVYSQLEVAYGEAIAVPENPVLRGHTFAGWAPDVPSAMPDSSMTFTAKFTVNQYTATFSIPSEDWEEVLTLDYGSTITPPTPPTKPGYTFAGWDKEIPATMPDSSIVFTGSYTQDFVALTLTATGNGTVTYDTNVVREGTHNFDVAKLSTVVLTFVPDAGHHLSGVTVDGEDAMSQVSEGRLSIVNITDSTSVYVTFEVNQYLVTFAYADTVYSQAEVAYGEAIAVPENPVLRGHTFAGWTPDVPPAMPDSSMTFTAKFTVNQYTATFSIPSEDWEEVLTLDYGSTITPPTPPTKPGYTFVGWDKEIPATMPDSSIVFTGSYTQDFVALTLTATGNGTVTYDTNVVREGTHNFDVAKLSTAVLTFVPDAGHHLSGVTVDGEDAMSQVSEGRLSIVNITDSTSVYVTFEVNQYLVTFDYADTVYSQLEVAYGETIAVPENPVLRGHTFAGWTPDVPPAMPDSSMTFTAKFTVNQYTATFSIPSEDWEEVLTLDYGSTITPPTPPTKPGYTFVGWDKEIPATMPDSAIVLIGSYTQNMVKLSLTASGQGTIVFGDENVRNETKVFEVAELSAVELTIREDLGSLLERVYVNEEDRTAELDDNKTLRLGGISEDTNVEVLFIEQSTSFTLDGLQYIIPDVRMGEIVLIGAEDMEHITIPNEVEYGGKQWAVTAIADSCFDENPSLISIRIPVSIESVGANLFKGCMHLAAINWEAKSHLTSTMMGTLSNPNLLLYIDRTDKAPVEINNVINLQSLTAERITLSDANVPGDFYCPTAFIAKEISYSHEYLQQTLSDKCQGWESIVLPFDVQIIKHETQGEIHPFATLLDEQIVDGDRPFWLYRFTEEGHFKEADGIRANEPYILSMPNEPELWDIYKLNGRVTFSATNVMVEPTADVVVVSAADRMFLPCYRHEAENTEWYLLNVGDAYDGHAEGGVFSAERPGRSAHPFEAYFEATGSSPVKGYYEIFEKENMNSVHSVQDIERNGDGAVYGIGGEKISNLHTSFSTLRLKRGLYIMPPTAGKKGRKVVVK